MVQETTLILNNHSSLTRLNCFQHGLALLHSGNHTSLKANGAAYPKWTYLNFLLRCEVLITLTNNASKCFRLLQSEWHRVLALIHSHSCAIQNHKWRSLDWERVTSFMHFTYDREEKLISAQFSGSLHASNHDLTVLAKCMQSKSKLIYMWIAWSVTYFPYILRESNMNWV